MRPASVLDLGNKLRPDEDRIPLPPGVDGGLGDDQLVHLLTEFGGGSVVEAGSNAPDIDESASLASEPKTNTTSGANLPITTARKNGRGGAGT
jgi:hypothetical protein